MDQKLTDLVNAHWEYVEGVIMLELKEFSIIPTVITGHLDLIGHHYRTAFIHGYKHGKEDINGNS